MAAGFAALEAGSDIGSSIRNPAHYCGIFGHKPTWGICPPLGHAMGGSVSHGDISVIGPLARSVADLSVALDAMAGPEAIEAGWKLDLPPPRAIGFKGLRVAAAMAHWRAEAERLGPDDTSYYAMMARGISMTHRDFLVGNETRQRMRRAWAAFFQDWDVFLCPPAASPAQPHDHAGERWQRTITVNGRKVPATDQMFWAGISGFYLLPATVAPLAASKDGLPVGVQIVGPQYGDRTTLAVAAMLETAWRGFIAPPGWD
jgi:amidase